MRRYLLSALLLSGVIGALADNVPAEPPPSQVVLAEIHGAITPASASYFLRALRVAADQQAEVLVLQLDTPGGLDSAMRDMIQALLASPVPVVIYVAPSGARAASAGTYLMYASHVAAMAPGTNLGAATPVMVGATGDGADEKKPDRTDDNGNSGGNQAAMHAKAVQDAAAYLRSLAQLRGRNVDWAEKAVRSADSLSAQDAYDNKVIDLLAADLPALLQQLDGRTITVAGQPRRLTLSHPQLRPLMPNWQENLLATIADPNVALLLMMIGVYGLIFEFYTPGMFGPGVLGGICLLLGMYGLAMLPINIAGAALLLLGIALMVAESYTPTFGALGLGGVIAFVLGALMLIDADIPGLQVSWQMVLPLALVSAIATAGIGVLALKSRQRRPVSGRESMLGETVRVVIGADQRLMVEGFGERWQARCAQALSADARVRVIAVDGLTLVVEPLVVEPLVVEPLVVEPLAVEPLAADVPGAGAAAANPPAKGGTS